MTPRNAASPSRSRSTGTPISTPIASAASALRTLCSPTIGSMNVPRSSPPRITRNVLTLAGDGVTPRRPATRTRCRAPPLRHRRQAERLNAAPRQRHQRRRIRAVDTDQREPGAGHQVHEPAKREAHGVEVRVDVRVIELDVVHDRDVRQVLEELRGLVEVGAVVFVALDDERLALPDAIAGAARCRSCGRCRRPAPSDPRRHASAASPPATSSWSCRGCRRRRWTACPRGRSRAPLRATSSSGASDRERPRALHCRARWRCPRSPGPTDPRRARRDSPRAA